MYGYVVPCLNCAILLADWCNTLSTQLHGKTNKSTQQLQGCAKATPPFQTEFQGKTEAKLGLLLVLTENQTREFFSFTFPTDVGYLPTENQAQPSRFWQITPA